MSGWRQIQLPDIFLAFPMFFNVVQGRRLHVLSYNQRVFSKNRRFYNFLEHFERYSTKTPLFCNLTDNDVTGTLHYQSMNI